MKLPTPTDPKMNETLQIHSESSTLSYTDCIKLYEDLQSWEWQPNKNVNTGKQNSRRSRQASKPPRNKIKTSPRKIMPQKTNVSVAGKVCKCAVSCAADCTAVCCCPCAVGILIILTLVKLPIAIARKSLLYAKKMAPINHNPKDDEDGNEKIESPGFSSSLSWSCGESPQRSGCVHVSSAPKLDSEKVWWELYATGRLGFVGVPLERN